MAGRAYKRSLAQRLPRSLRLFRMRAAQAVAAMETVAVEMATAAEEMATVAMVGRQEGQAWHTQCIRCIARLSSRGHGRSPCTCSSIWEEDFRVVGQAGAWLVAAAAGFGAVVDLGEAAVASATGAPMGSGAATLDEVTTPGSLAAAMVQAAAMAGRAAGRASCRRGNDSRRPNPSSARVPK